MRGENERDKSRGEGKKYDAKMGMVGELGWRTRGAEPAYIYDMLEQMMLTVNLSCKC
jgi:hypothetical protein